MDLNLISKTSFVPTYTTNKKVQSVKFSSNNSTFPSYERLFINMQGYDRNENWARRLFAERNNFVQAVAEPDSEIYSILKKIVPVYLETREGDFGHIRTKRHVTPIFPTSHYGPYHPRSIELMENAGSIDVHEELGSYPDSELTLKDRKGFIQRVTLDDGRSHIPITGLVYGDYRGEEYISIVHLLPKPIRKTILARTNTLLENIKDLKDGPKNDNTLKEAIDSIAEVHYLLVHLMLYKRGSAGITDVLTKSLFDYLEIYTPSWRSKGTTSPAYPGNFPSVNGGVEEFIRGNGVSPDLEAFVTDLDSFKQNYPYFFQEPLRYI